jgi:hypothetical protein
LSLSKELRAAETPRVFWTDKATSWEPRVGKVPIDFLLNLLDGLLQRQPRRRLTCTESLARMRTLGLASPADNDYAPLFQAVTRVLQEAPVFSRTLEVVSQPLVAHHGYHPLRWCDYLLEETRDGGTVHG